jgi:SnoaL-like domain
MTDLPEAGPDTLLCTTEVRIAVEGDSAEAKSDFMAVHQRDGLIAPLVYGRYCDILERREGVWGFQERTMNVDRIDDLSSHLHSAPGDVDGSEVTFRKKDHGSAASRRAGSASSRFASATLVHTVPS